MALTDLVRNKKGITFIEMACMVAMVATISISIYASYLGIRALRKYINEPSIERVNVRGGPEAELFIDKEGKRFYGEIDGKPIEEYLDK